MNCNISSRDNGKFTQGSRSRFLTMFLLFMVNLLIFCSNFVASVRKVQRIDSRNFRRCITLLLGRVIESRFSYVTQEAFHAFDRSRRGCFSRNSCFAVFRRIIQSERWQRSSDVYIFSIFFFPVFVISGAPNLFQGSLGYVLIINIPEYYRKQY